MLDGHAGQSVTEKHHMRRPTIEAMAWAVSVITLSLPERSGVPITPGGIVLRIVPARDGRRTTSRQAPEFIAFLQEHPIEFPQFRHL
jgi:hypothetical protein